jgi:multidrug efflux pump subunit AcrA (membrane-fusion protein)
MNNTLRKSLIATLLVAVTSIFPACSSQNTSTPQLIKVQKGDIAITVASDGNLALINDRKLTFQTSGIIKEVKVKEGDRVIEGQVLARLDTQPLELTISTASLAIKSAELDLQVAKNSYEKITYPYSYTTFALSVPDSLAAIAEAQRNIDEVQKKITAGVNPDDLVTLRQNLKNAQDNLIRAREKLGIGTGQDPFTTGRIPISNFWTMRDTQLAMDKAQLALDKVKNDLQQANDQIPKTFITAPFDGIISQVNVKEGDTISSVEYSSKVIFYLVDPDNLELKGTIDEIDVAKVALRQKASITLDALPDAKIPGELIYIAPVSRVEGGVVVYDVKIKLEPEASLSLKSGMTAKADIVTEKKINVLLVPDRAITRTGGNTTVKVMVNGKLQDKAISVGITDGVSTEITSGLNEADEIIIERKT